MERRGVEEMTLGLSVCSCMLLRRRCSYGVAQASRHLPARVTSDGGPEADRIETYIHHAQSTESRSVIRQAIRHSSRHWNILLTRLSAIWPYMSLECARVCIRYRHQRLSISNHTPGLEQRQALCAALPNPNSSPPNERGDYDLGSIVPRLGGVSAASSAHSSHHRAPSLTYRHISCG